MLQRSPKFVSWLIKNHPAMYLKLKGVGMTHLLSKDSKFLQLNARLVKSSVAVMRLEERYNIYQLAKAVANRKGAMAEVGVYTGGSAKILCTVKENSPLYLFDTFGGMPKVNKLFDGLFREGDFANCSLEGVQKLLAGYKNVHFCPGVFPKSAAKLEKKKLKFKFVHLDVDIYQSTLDGLNWFYPRMIKGGVIISHDYSDTTVPGVKKAFDEFFADKPEIVIPVWFSQAVITKL